MATKARAARAKQEPIALRELEFRMVRSNDFHVYPVEGAIGSITPHHLLRIDLYHEYRALPSSVWYEVDPTTHALSEARREQEYSGFVREVQCALLVNPANARRLRDWLNDKITELEQLESED